MAGAGTSHTLRADKLRKGDTPDVTRNNNQFAHPEIGSPDGHVGTSVQFRDWIGSRSVSDLCTNVGAASLAFQKWRRFKEAFDPELVERALTETRASVRHISDPFGGSGTTALAAQFLGVRPTTIEVNPFLADLIEAKVASVDFNRTSALYRQIIERVLTNGEPADPIFEGAPSTFVEPGRNGRYIFPRKVARRILAYRAAINDIADPVHRRLFRVILASAAVPSSNIIVSGKGRRYRGRWKERESPPRVVDDLFRDGMLQAIQDLRKFSKRKCLEYRVIRGDARQLTEEIGSHDLSVFSPPYPNSFDYTDVYNVELWAMGYLDGGDANKRLRQSTLNSHVQLIRRFDSAGVKSLALTRSIAALRDVRNRLWNRHIPEMFGAYARDMWIVMRKLSEVLRPLGRVYIVVGDSSYAGVVIPVARIISEIAQTVGYDVVELEPFRSMRSSPQQGGIPELRETLVILERQR